MPAKIRPEERSVGVFGRTAARSDVKESFSGHVMKAKKQKTLIARTAGPPLPSLWWWMGSKTSSASGADRISFIAPTLLLYPLGWYHQFTGLPGRIWPTR